MIARLLAIAVAISLPSLAAASEELPAAYLHQDERLELWAPAKLACTVLLIRPDHSALELTFGLASFPSGFWSDRPNLQASLQGIPPGHYLWEMSCGPDDTWTTMGRLVVLDSMLAARRPLPAVWTASPGVDRIIDAPSSGGCGRYVPPRRVRLRVPTTGASGQLTARARVRDQAGLAVTEFAAIDDDGLFELDFDPVPGRRLFMDLCVLDAHGSELCWHQSVELVPKRAQRIHLQSFQRERARANAAAAAAAAKSQRERSWPRWPLLALALAFVLYRLRRRLPSAPG